MWTQRHTQRGHWDKDMKGRRRAERPSWKENENTGRLICRFSPESRTNNSCFCLISTLSACRKIMSFVLWKVKRKKRKKIIWCSHCLISPVYINLEVTATEPPKRQKKIFLPCVHEIIMSCSLWLYSPSLATEIHKITIISIFYQHKWP